MHDRRDYLIAALAASLLFCLGILVGQGWSVLPDASAQDSGFDPDQPIDPGSAPGSGDAPSVPTPIDPAAGSVATVAPTASDSNSNNRFVAVTCPIGSGESVLYVLDAKEEQVVVYRFRRRKGLEFLAARKIDYDLRVKGYKDVSEFTRDDLKQEYNKSIARAVAKAAKEGKGG